MHAHQILTALLALGLTVSLAPVAWQAYGPNGHQRRPGTTAKPAKPPKH